MKRIFMIGYSTDKGGVEAYIKNISSQLEDKYEIILHWPTITLMVKNGYCQRIGIITLSISSSGGSFSMKISLM